MGCFENQSDLPASPVSTISRDSWQQTRHHCGGEHHPHYRLPYAEARNNVPGTGRQLLRQTQPPANYPTTGKTSAGSRPHSDSRANTVSIPVERLTEGIFKGAIPLIDGKTCFTRGSSPIGLDYDFAGHSSRGHIGCYLAVGVHGERGRRHPAKRHLRGLRERGSCNRHRRSHWTAGRTEAEER